METCVIRTDKCKIHSKSHTFYTAELRYRLANNNNNNKTQLSGCFMTVMLEVEIHEPNQTIKWLNGVFYSLYPASYTCNYKHLLIVQICKRLKKPHKKITILKLHIHRFWVKLKFSGNLVHSVCVFHHLQISGMNCHV